MHTGCLGVVAWFLGSVLWELVYDGPFEGSVDRRIKAVWGHIVHWYDELGVKNRLGQLTLEMFKTTGNFACLKGKAAENHQLLPVLRALCSQLGAFPTETDTGNALWITFPTSTQRSRVQGCV